MRYPRATLHAPRRIVALMMVMTLTTMACAGSVGRYRNAAAQDGGLGVPALGADDGLGQAGGGQFGTGSVGQGGGSAPGVGGVTGGTDGGAASGGGSGAAPGGRAPGGIGSTTGVTADTIKIGLFYPKTGHLAPLLRKTPEVVRAAFDVAGPIHGREVVVETYDDGSGNASTIQAEEKRAKDEVFAYLSTLSEANVIVGPLANQHRVPAIVGSSDEKVARELRYAFSLLSYWSYQGTLLAGFIKNYLNDADKRIGIVYEGSHVADSAREAFKAEAKRTGLKVVFEQPVAKTPSTCSNEVSNLQARDVELVTIMSGALPAICMLRDARALGYDPVWTGAGVWYWNGVPRAVGDAADGIKLPGPVTTLETPAGRRFAEVMRESGNSDTVDDDLMMWIYSFTIGLIEGLGRTGPSLGREAFVRTFETKMNGFSSGYLPPPKFGPGDRSGPQGLSVIACCSDRNWWYTVDPRWRRF